MILFGVSELQLVASRRLVLAPQVGGGQQQGEQHQDLSDKQQKLEGGINEEESHAHVVDVRREEEDHVDDDVEEKEQDEEPPGEVQLVEEQDYKKRSTKKASKKASKKGTSKLLKLVQNKRVEETRESGGKPSWAKLAPEGYLNGKPMLKSVTDVQYKWNRTKGTNEDKCGTQFTFDGQTLGWHMELITL